MISHQLDTPLNGYLGSDYGSIIPDLLQQPQRLGLADAVIKKIQKDVPLANALPRGSLNIYSVPDGADKMNIFIDANGQIIDAGRTM